MVFSLADLEYNVIDKGMNQQIFILVALYSDQNDSVWFYFI